MLCSLTKHYKDKLSLINNEPLRYDNHLLIKMCEIRYNNIEMLIKYS